MEAEEAEWVASKLAGACSHSAMNPGALERLQRAFPNCKLIRQGFGAGSGSGGPASAAREPPWWQRAGRKLPEGYRAGHRR